jgi:hypothetical protein
MGVRKGMERSLHFQDVNANNKITFLINDEGIADETKLLKLSEATVKHDQWPHSITYTDFLKSFKALHLERKIINYDDKQSQTLVTLKETNADYDATNLVEKMEEINKIND